ncbi:hypothetical protein ASE25_00900 [Terrabacter sp. Root85]|uniref:hypothetical protein n=1 Tax=Terrabacter sp. Root85 TaxID=1736603 RepID=UPI0006F4BE9E|nr:hypothetical protein [Terrabacter sp. Root85]KRC91977.1 hypothetical protein ASE25_00900 [Terrabacter sp. Root85]
MLGVVLALSVSGCAKDGGSAFTLPQAGSPAGPSTGDLTSRAPTDPGPTTPSPATPAATVATATSDPAAPVVVAGRVMARRAGLSFEVPDGWQAIDPSSATRAGASVLPDSFRTLAEQSGMTADEFMRRVGTAIDVMVMGRPRHGFADNVSVIPTPGTRLPSAADLRSQLELAGASVDRVDRTTTAVGEALVAKSRVPLATMIVASRSLAVQLDGHVTYITVSASDWDAADAIADGILRTLRRA